jgi:hypothetical protein
MREMGQFFRPEMTQMLDFGPYNQALPSGHLFTDVQSNFY